MFLIAHPALVVVPISTSHGHTRGRDMDQVVYCQATPTNLVTIRDSACQLYASLVETTRLTESLSVLVLHEIDNLGGRNSIKHRRHTLSTQINLH